MGLEGRVALVTGGSRGIGAGIALGLAADGADVAVSYRKDEASAQEIVSTINGLGRVARAYQASIDDPEQSAAMAEAVLSDYGSVDILVNNAGIASRGQNVENTEPAEFERVWRTHCLGAFVLSKLVIPSMRRRPRGDIVMISSAATNYLAGWSSPYNVAKASIEALASTIAKEERQHGIRVNIVAPGLVVSEMGRRLVKATQGVDDISTLDEKSPFGHVCTPEEVADVVRFVVSDAAGYLTNQRIYVDGGGF